MMINIVRDSLYLVGFGAIAYGMSLLHPSAGLVAVGVPCLIVAYGLKGKAAT